MTVTSLYKGEKVMKNWTKEKLEKALVESVESEDVVGGIDFCLKQLYQDKTKYLKDEIVHGLTFEELIGVLFDSRKTIQKKSEWDF